MPKTQFYHSTSESDTAQAGIQIADQLSLPSCVYISGNLGTGKTTLTRSMVQHLGYSGSVTSPTYNLVHEYPISGGTVYHIDLYRLQYPEESVYLALEDCCSATSLFLVEWPEKGVGFLPPATHTLHLQKTSKDRPKDRKIGFTVTER